MSKNEKGTCKQMLLTPSNEKFGSGDSSKYWVLGDIFLQNYYSIYDLPKGKVGLIEFQPSLTDCMSVGLPEIGVLKLGVYRCCCGRHIEGSSPFQSRHGIGLTDGYVRQQKQY